ncbi:DMT family transporter [Nocardioides alkalitolerans]|uniref:DMT family transporter n=1 Tax=Nocardioides alkalitolerans TaxID=281714 RepID=UPI0003FB5D99|nr:DMT family transporter [Nocardioides alkalitolerans]
MEDKWRWAFVTAVAPIAWGSTYYVTRHTLPADAALWGSALRALPAGLLLLLLARRLPRGAWWWRSAVLGTLNVGAFFVLVYLAAQLLPTSVAASVMAAAPVTMMLLAWAMVGERPTARLVAGATTGIAGVLLVVTTSVDGLDLRGVLASVAAMTMSSVGFVLSKRWADGTPVLTTTAWQLMAGGLALTVVAVAVEGAPPAVDARAVAGFAYISLVGTALAFVCWFAGLARLSAGAVGIVGLLNPVTGVLLGTVLAAESLSPTQVVGIALVLAGVVVGQQTGRAQRARAASASEHSRATSLTTRP